jgi:Tfp pilus assembly protein PilZ
MWARNCPGTSRHDVARGAKSAPQDSTGPLPLRGCDGRDERRGARIGVIRVTRGERRLVERRRMTHPRTRTLIPTEFRASALAGVGKVKNVSEGGLFVGTSVIPEEGETVELKLNTPGSPPIEVTGFVWWTTSDSDETNATSGFGLRLLDPDERYLRLLESLD